MLIWQVLKAKTVVFPLALVVMVVVIMLFLMVMVIVSAVIISAVIMVIVVGVMAVTVTTVGPVKVTFRGRGVQFPPGKLGSIQWLSTEKQIPY